VTKASTFGIVLAGTLVATTACGFLDKDGTDVDDVIDNSGGYGFKVIKDAGYSFTNGLTTLSLRKGPLTIKKVEPVMAGPTLRLLGVKVRHVPPEAEGAVFQEQPGWPSVRKKDESPGEWRKLADPGGFAVPAPTSTEPPPPVVQVLVGYEITGNGRGVMRGMYITFEYRGKTRRIFEGSYLAVCSPSTVKCQQEDADGPVADNELDQQN
jgi:hypothetical protein